MTGKDTMKKFRNILFVSNALQDETAAMKQALSLSRNNEATLKALLVCPGLPNSLDEYAAKYKEALTEQLAESICKAQAALKMEEKADSIPVVIESGSTPAIRIIRHVLRDSCDLVVKDAQPSLDGKGFMAVDMELLRKCPSAVWLCRPIEQARDKIKVAVAIDAESLDRAGHDLALQLLQISRSLADTCSGQLDIVSCWDFEFEEYLHYNPWASVPKEQISQAIAQTQSRNTHELARLITESGIGGDIKTHQLRGRAEKLIPTFVRDEKIDILVMGTVARTGIAGFTMGNTAENIFNVLGCSLLALKPNGFASPVKAY
jgi:nucleotide-binding universal stress UspA family protein